MSPAGLSNTRIPTGYAKNLSDHWVGWMREGGQRVACDKSLSAKQNPVTLSWRLLSPGTSMGPGECNVLPNMYLPRTFLSQQLVADQGKKAGGTPYERQGMPTG